MATRWEEYRKKNGVTPLDMLNPKTRDATPDEAKRRFDICLSCPELIDLTKQCKQCGCFMNLKTKLLAAKCPIQKW